MMLEKDNLGTDIKSKLEGLKTSPEEEVWDKIEATLTKRKRRKGLVLFFVVFGFCATVLCLFILALNEHDIDGNKPRPKPKLELSRTQEIDASTKENQTTPLVISKVEESSEISYSEPASFKNNSFKSSSSGSKKISARSLNHEDKAPHVQSNTDSSSTPNGYKSENKYSLNKNNNNISIGLSESLSSDNKDAPKELKTTGKSKLTDSISSSLSGSKWSIQPHLIGSYFGSFNTQNSSNFDLNYGVLINYRINTEVYARTGLRVLKLVQTINDEQFYFNYFQIPLEIKYAPFSKSLNPYFIGGLNYFNLNDTSYEDDYSATMGLTGGIGIEKLILKNLFLNLESNFYYQLKPFSGDSTLNNFILSLNFGLEYRF